MLIDGLSDVRVTATLQNKPSMIDPSTQPIPYGPVLGRKNYTETLGRGRRTEVIDETSSLIHETRDPVQNEMP